MASRIVKRHPVHDYFVSVDSIVIIFCSCCKCLRYRRDEKSYSHFQCCDWFHKNMRILYSNCCDKSEIFDPASVKQRRSPKINVFSQFLFLRNSQTSWQGWATFQKCKQVCNNFWRTILLPNIFFIYWEISAPNLREGNVCELYVGYFISYLVEFTSF